MDQDHIVKLICFAVGCIIAFYILIWLLPYVVIFFALLGAGYLYQEYLKNNRQ